MDSTHGSFRTDSNRSIRTEQIRKQVEKGFARRNIEFVRSIFDSHKRKESELISTSSLVSALSDLGSHIQAAEIDELLNYRSLNDVGIDFQEFLSLVGTPSPIEEWVKELPLTQLVADAMPCIDCLKTDQLRHLSRATRIQLEESCETIKEYLFKILQEKLIVLKEAYEKLDSQPAPDCNSKFQISKMSVGNIDDFHEGLANRIGDKPNLFL